MVYVYMNHLIFGCRKKKAVHKTNTTDDKKLQSTLKRIGVNSIPAIEEVNIFKDDVVIQFTNPKGKYFLIYHFVSCKTFFMLLMIIVCLLLNYSSSFSCCKHMGC